ncbi:MAG: TetR/AcrR family transcriptional regulator [Acidimicrobiia bacterium]
MATDDGLRARKKRQTARRIEDAALDLFDRDGFEATTVEEIAAAADISPRTFFHYFATKDDVVLADYAERLTRVTEVLRGQPRQISSWQALMASFQAVAADYEQERDALLRRFRIMASTESVFARSLQLQAGWEDAVADLLAARHDNSGEPPPARLLAASAMAAMRAALHHWVAAGARASLPAIVQDHFTRLGAGLDRPRR